MGKSRRKKLKTMININRTQNKSEKLKEEQILINFQLLLVLSIIPTLLISNR